MKSSLRVVTLSFVASVCLAGDVQMYAVPSIFVGVDGNKVNFSKALATSPADQWLGKGKDHFVTKMKDSFKTVETIDKMNLNKTFVAYIKVPRVSLYQVPKTVDRTNYYLPITSTFSVANMKTGEILYSTALTHYTVYEGLKDGISDEMQQEFYKNGFFELSSDLIQKGKETFKPFQVEAKIIDTYDSYSILNQGTDGGIVYGDTLSATNGSDIKVIYADQKYSVAIKQLGDTSSGDICTKTSSGSITSLKRPKVGLVENTTNYKGFAWETIKQVFTDKIGEQASFSILPIDKTFYQAQELAFTEAKSGLSQELRNKRSLPSMFAKIDIGKTHFWKLPSDKEYASFDNYATNACALMCNTSGIITYSACSTEKRQDQVIGNSRFSNDQTSEIITKNAVLKIAEEFSKNVKPYTKKTVIKEIESDGTLILESADVFKKDENGQIFRSLGSIKNINNIKIPIAEAKIFGDDTSKAKIVIGGKPKTGDELSITSMGANTQDKVITFGDAVAMEGEKLSEFDMMAPYIIAANTKYSCLAPSAVRQNIEQTFTSVNGFEKNIVIKNSSSQFVAIPRYQIGLKNEKCDDQKMCQAVYNIYSDIKVFNGVNKNNEPVFDNGYELDITLTYMQNDKGKVDYELTEETLKLIAKISQEIKL